MSCVQIAKGQCYANKTIKWLKTARECLIGCVKNVYFYTLFLKSSKCNTAWVVKFIFPKKSLVYRPLHCKCGTVLIILGWYYKHLLKRLAIHHVDREMDVNASLPGNTKIKANRIGCFRKNQIVYVYQGKKLSRWNIWVAIICLYISYFYLIKTLNVFINTSLKVY